MEDHLVHVPGGSHYSPSYLGDARVFSYAHQIQAVRSLNPRAVIEVGAGGGTVTAALRTIGIAMTTVDVQPELNPDVLASVTNMPFDNRQFDAALCCQVLEHLPFEQFGAALLELRRVSRLGAVLSLPDITRDLALSWRLPLIGRGEVSFYTRRTVSSKTQQSRFDRMGHYWEIGYPNVPLKRVMMSITSAGWSVERTWRVPELPWHRFFLLVTPAASRDVAT